MIYINKRHLGCDYVIVSCSRALDTAPWLLGPNKSTDLNGRFELGRAFSLAPAPSVYLIYINKTLDA